MTSPSHNTSGNAPLDLAINGAAVVTAQGESQVNIGVRGGVIVTLSTTPLIATETVNAHGLHVLPGLVDLHVHFSEPGRDWEGWHTGTRSAAAGGVTSVVDMPLNAIPATTDAPALQQKLDAAHGVSLVDYGLWGGLVRDNRAHIDELIAGGVVGLKAFMYDTTDPTFPPAPDGVLHSGMQTLARHGSVLSVHAENSDLIHTLMRDLQDAGADGPQAWLDAHPPVSETEAVARAIAFAKDTACRLHIVHVSLPESVSLITAAKQQGVQVTCEVCAHHLTLDAEAFKRIGPNAKCAPPLRDPAAVAGLWQHLLAGNIDTIASDHSPCTTQQKTGSIWQTWGGINALQLTLPIMLDHAKQGRLSLSEVVKLCSTTPADLMHWPHKGRITPGADADLLLVDTQETWTFTTNDLVTRHPWSPFDGTTFQGRLKRTWLRGQTIYPFTESAATGEWQRGLSGV